MRIERKIEKILTENSWTLSTAESCTGGYLASKITDVAGSSNYFSHGYITYSNESKLQDLDISISSLEEFGVYSGKTAEFMAEGVRSKTETTFGIATTGIAPPGDSSTSLLMGTTFIGLSFDGLTRHLEVRIKSKSRRRFKKKVVYIALKWAYSKMCEYEEKNKNSIN
ncbi:MAG: CinA family protein [Candidatus Heimdallarchaeaceae archaeon]